MARDYSAATSATLPAELAGLRLDLALAKAFPQFSRSRLQAWLKAGHVSVRRAGAPVRAAGRALVLGGEQVEISPPDEPHAGAPPAQRLPLAIVHEDRDLLVIDKPAGLVVHPGAGNPDRTLMNALLAHDASLAKLPRAGIVHRLDKDTSGLLVVARTPGVHAALVRMLEAREVHREYEAVCVGVMTGDGTVDAPIGRH